MKRVITVLLAGLLGAMPSREVLAAPADVVDIGIADTFDSEERTLLRKWMSDAAREGMAAAKVDAGAAGDRTLVIDVKGMAPDYKLVIGVRRGATWLEKRERNCLCGDAELFQHVREDVEAVAPALTANEASAAPVTPTKPPASAASPNSRGQPDEPRRRPVSTKLVTGAILLPVGVAGLAAGVWMAVKGEKRTVGANEDLAHVTNLRPGGIALAIVGAAALGTGIALLVVDARARKRGGARAMVLPSGPGLTLVGRF